MQHLKTPVNFNPGGFWLVLGWFFKDYLNQITDISDLTADEHGVKSNLIARHIKSLIAENMPIQNKTISTQF